MNISFRYRLFIGFTLAIALSAVSGIVSYRIFNRQSAQREWVKRTHHIIDSAQTLQSFLVDMETGHRAFRITNDQKYLEQYDTAAPRIDPLLQSIIDSLAGNPTEQSRARELARHVHALVNFWVTQTQPAATIADTRQILSTSDTGSYNHAYISLLTAEEKTQMDQVRGMISTIEKNETKLLSERREEYDTIIRDATISASAGSVISEFIIIVLSILIFREFKRRRLIQEQLKESIEKLEQQTAELRTSEEEQKRALTEVETVNKQLEKFVYTVAHDIKSPLAGISGSLSILEMEEAISSNPELAEFVSLSRGRVVYLTQMVNSILEYSRTTIGQQQVELVNTRSLVEGITNLMMPPQNMMVSITGPMPELKTSRIKIMEVFQNLISNAIKYNNKKEGTIEIGCVEKGPFYEFYVKDNGNGIPAANIPHIFSMFREAPMQPVRESSTGFGLNIVKLIIEEQGGKIWVESTPGEGSTFYFQWKK